jgi:dolichol-phosphate mannosyltransferase
MKKLSIVIPCFNSAENIPDLQAELESLNIRLVNYELEIILVDDGSQDDTYQKLLDFLNTTDLRIQIVKLTGNFGSYNAFLAGLHHGTGDVYAQLHPDLQDPADHLPDMLSYWEKDIPFVIGQRVAREDSNQLTAKFYHWLMKKIALPHIPSGGYDLIVFDKELRDHVVKMNETNTNLVYLISWLQYPYVTIPIKRVNRKKGKSQWTFRKKSKLMIDSIVSFSYTPIRLISISAAAIFCLSVIVFLWIIFSQLSFSLKLAASLALLFGNCTLLFLSVIGEYVWRNLEAARKRPPFIVETVDSS